MDDVARVSGFSQMTVSRAFGRSASIRSETRERILSVAADMGYVRNKAAATLASNRSRAFGIILPTLQDSIYLPFVEAARRVFEEGDYDFALQAIDYAQAREPEAISSLLALRVQAILLPSIGHTSRTKKLLQNLPLPVIEVGNLPKQPVNFAVGHSDLEAGYLATKRLIEIGRRKIGLICGHPRATSNARDRLEGHRRAMREAGLAVSDATVAQVEHSVDAALRGLSHLTDATAGMDGLVVGGEIWTAAVVLQLIKAGRSVPRDVAVVGIGEVELGPYLPVPLTYVALPRAETGRRAAKLAIALSRGEPVEETIIRLPIELVIKGTA